MTVIFMIASTRLSHRLVPLTGDQLDPRVVVHPLILCPPLGHGVRYVLVRRDWPGTRNVLGVGRATSGHASANLAEVRLRAARLGANEVHCFPRLNIASGGGGRFLILNCQPCFAMVGHTASPYY